MLGFGTMVDAAKPGDRVTVTGIYVAVPMRVNPRQRAIKSVYRTFIRVLHIQRDEQSSLFRCISSPPPQPPVVTTVAAAVGGSAAQEACSPVLCLWGRLLCPAMELAARLHLSSV